MSETAAETKTTITKDKIEKEILLRASRARVWRALTDAAEFGAWFGMKLGGPFVVGERVNGKVTIPGFTHLTLDLAVERMEAERLFSYRWHPYATIRRSTTRTSPARWSSSISPTRPAVPDCR
jgi:uncharacterized protein YndB with AHSA1/START domain